MLLSAVFSEHPRVLAGDVRHQAAAVFIVDTLPERNQRRSDDERCKRNAITIENKCDGS
jgi:hypothetical protein